MTSRGARNNNPGNIRRSKDAWQGLSKTQTDKAFFQFTTPVWGIRALARILMTYRDKHHCFTIREIILRWAPPNENNTAAYISRVAKLTGGTADGAFDVQQYDKMLAIVKAIITVELGTQPYDEVTLSEALKLAGLVREPPSRLQEIVKNPSVALQTASAAAATCGSIVAQVSDVWDTIGGLINPRFIITALTVVTVLAAGYTLYDWLRKRKIMGF